MTDPDHDKAAAFSSQAASEHVTPTMRATLRAIVRYSEDHHEMPMAKHLAEMLDMKKAGVRDRMRDLYLHGLIERVSNARSHYRITEKGRKELEAEAGA